jgi:DNA-binding MarR family transcriptional regulator
LTEPRLSLAEQAAHKFLIINRYLRQYVRQMDNSQGVRPREFSVLRFLLEGGPATVGQIQDYLYHSASVTSTVIAKLEEAGHVTRTRSIDDNRVVVVELTPTGQAIAEQAPMGGIPLLRRRLPTLSEARLVRINGALDDLMELMEITAVE